MNTDSEPSPKKKSDKTTDNLTVSVEKCDLKKTEKSPEEPKPRIVLTIRSEKSSAKNNNMKVVSTEEKQEEFSPRRSCRTRGKWEWVCDSETSTSPKKDKSISENDDETITPKRSASRRNKDSDNVIANAIARKEKMYDDITPQRSTRRQKAKPVEEIPQEKPEEGVRTRRSAKPAVVEPEIKSKVKSEQDVIEIDEDSHSQGSDVKLKHLCELGLKAIKPDEDDEEFVEGRELEEMEDDEELDDDTEVISKLLEADEEEADSTSDEEFLCAPETSSNIKTRRSKRLCNSHVDDDSSHQLDDEKISRRRSTRRTKTNRSDSIERNDRPKRKRVRSACAEEASEEEIPEENAEPADAEEGTEATCPPEDSTIVATCLCEETSNVYAAPGDLSKPVFCQAIEMSDGVRVGCSHPARRDPDGEYSALIRAGPRAPFFLACTLHASQLAKHMCCAACGLFCTQGIFYQCSKSHLFHVECAFSTNDSSKDVGCPHCGVYSYRWLPANTECYSVKVTMTCSNKKIFLPEQREQCTPAYLSFSSKIKAKVEPIIPEDLLPSPQVDLGLACKEPVSVEDEEEALQELCDAILAGENVNNLITKIAGVQDVNRAVSSACGASCVHVAARCGNGAALYALHAGGAGDLNKMDDNMRTPLILAVSVLVDKSGKKIKDIKKEDKDTSEEMEVDQDKEEDNEKGEQSDGEEKGMETAEKERPKDDDLMKVIRYLIAAGCDLNIADSEGMTAFHIAAEHGHLEACTELINGGADVEVKDNGGWTPLVWAAENDHSHVVRLLLNEGADAMSIDKEGNSAVHWCAAAGASRSLPLLIGAAPDAVHALNSTADTPLHVAARGGHYSCVVILLARGAKMDIANSTGELPIDVCGDPSRRAISLNMQMAVVVKQKLGQRNVLSCDITNGRELYPIPCINEVDSTPLPQDFVYVTSHVLPAHIPIDNTIETMQGCTCKDGTCSSETCSCCVLSVRRWARAGRLPHDFPHHDPPVLFECNDTCGCNKKKCTNNLLGSLLERGATFVRTELYRCRGGAGWGLRARGAVRRGAPVAVYCGELLASAAADTRPTDHYMFALDLKTDLLEQCADKTQLCIDAASYGSAARFMNHSCDANTAPVRVFTRHRDLRLPHVALFATRDIQPGEPLTFDYGEKFWGIKSKWMKCECGAAECRYPVKGSSKDSN